MSVMLGRGAVGGTENLVRINLRGTSFETDVATLNKLSGSRLSNLTQEDAAFDAKLQQYFFDRNPHIFHYILDAHHTGQLHFPHNICPAWATEELLYWGIQLDHVSPCCREILDDYQEEQEKWKQLENAFQLGESQEGQTQISSSCNVFCRWRWKIWQFLDDPSSSAAAKCWAIFSTVVMITWTMSQVLGTFPTMRNMDSPSTMLKDLENHTSPKMQLFSKNPVPWIHVITIICTVIMVAEIVLRLCLCPRKCHFLKSPLNLIDILCPLAVLAVYVIHYAPTVKIRAEDAFLVFRMVGSLWLLRLLRCVKYITGLKVMLLALKASAQELGLLVAIIAMGVVQFSALIYYSELKTPNNFANMFKGCWWSIITFTTVGYGDEIPQTVLGHIVGILCALTGMVIIGLPIPIIASNFTTYYVHSKKRHRKKENMNNANSCCSKRNIAKLSKIRPSADKCNLPAHRHVSQI